MEHSKLLEGVNKYYTDKVKEFGATPSGVDWNSKESQYIRFKQLCRVISADQPFSLLDYGCGYGELINFLNTEYTGTKFEYFGYDVSETMIQSAKQLFEKSDHIRFNNSLPANAVDYTIASGIFNVKLDLADNNEWMNYITHTLNEINALSTKGFSFNALTKYSDKSHMKDYLFYADPLTLFDYCKTHFSRNVALLHDYNLYEFTINVKK